MVIGVVLAGGQSRRMGTPKESLPWGSNPQRTWLAHATERLAVVCTRVIVSRGRNGGGLRDDPGLFGPVAGIATVLHQIDTDLPGARCLFLPVDMPLVTPGTLRSIINAAQSGAPVAITDSLFPLCLPARPLWAETARTTAQADRPERRSVKSLINTLPPEPIHWLPAEPAGEFVNVNTPAERTAIRDAGPYEEISNDRTCKR